MNIVMYTKGLLGQKVNDYIYAVNDVTAVGSVSDSVPVNADEYLILAEHCDNNISIPHISVNEMVSLYQNGNIDAVIVASNNELTHYIVKRLSGFGINNIAVVPSYYAYDYEINDLSFIWIDNSKPRMPYLEYHISFHCNLKCAGCTHFSNIVHTPVFGNLERFRNDLERLRELFWGIGKIRLMGGEPLLNEDLPQFIYVARDTFPDADIRVVSNGLLLSERHEDVLNAMRDTAVLFDVSMYPPTRQSISRISRICEEHNVILTVTSDIMKFSAGMNLDGTSDPGESYKACPANHCAYLCDGRISTCAMPQLIDLYNNEFGTRISPAESDIIDIYARDVDGYELLRRIKQPMSICSFCDPVRREYNWFVSRFPTSDEWIGNLNTSEK